ncbi:hypothetical protein GF325_01080 [Candidatus Bathyarchaeota archaeon]|nr:hypothetical protein [Candidatus Bathyarchaeota archaeon]
MTTPVWVEALPGECNHDPLADIKKKEDIKGEHPSLAAMLQDLKERQYKPDNGNRYIIKSLKKPIFRAFEYVTFLKGGNIPFSVASRDLFGVVTIDGESINFLACVHNDEMEVERPIDVKFILDLGNMHHGVGEWKVEASARIDSGSSNPYETWLTMDSPFDLDRDQYKLLEKSTNPKPAALAGMMQGDASLEFSLHMEGHSFNFIRFARSRSPIG